MTTAYNLTDTVIRPRKRPSATSTSASITRPVFGDSPRKDLPIPVSVVFHNGLHVQSILAYDSIHTIHMDNMENYFSILGLCVAIGLNRPNKL